MKPSGCGSAFGWMVLVQVCAGVCPCSVVFDGVAHAAGEAGMPLVPIGNELVNRPAYIGEGLLGVRAARFTSSVPDEAQHRAAARAYLAAGIGYLRSIRSAEYEMQVTADDEAGVEWSLRRAVRAGVSDTGELYFFGGESVRPDPAHPDVIELERDVWFERDYVWGRQVAGFIVRNVRGDRDSAESSLLTMLGGELQHQPSPVRGWLLERMVRAEVLRHEVGPDGRVVVAALCDFNGPMTEVEVVLDPAKGFAPSRWSVFDASTGREWMRLMVDDWLEAGGVWLPRSVRSWVWVEDAWEDDPLIEQGLITALEARGRRPDEISFVDPDDLLSVRQCYREVFGERGPPARLLGMGVYRERITRLLTLNVPFEVDESRMLSDGVLVGDGVHRRFCRVEDGLLVPISREAFEQYARGLNLRMTEQAMRERAGLAPRARDGSSSDSDPGVDRASGGQTP